MFFDPHTKYLGRAITNKGKPGIKLNLETHRHKIQRFTDQFKPYNGLFDCDLSKDSTMKSYEGTLFRFPLRTKEQAMKSEISNQHYSDTVMMELLRLLETAAHHILMYTQNVQLIKVFHLTAAATSAQEMTLWLSVERNLVKVLRNVISTTRMPPKHAGKSTISNTLPNNILQQCSFLMKNYREKRSEESVFCELSAIYNIAVKYGNAEHTKFANMASKGSDSYWLVVSCSGRNDSLDLALQDSSLIPVGGAAAQLEMIDESSFKTVNIQFGLKSVGMVYCFLPLPIQFNLPVHINGFFAVHSSRTHLHERVAIDKEDRRAIWNEALMSDAVCLAYCILMQDLTRCSQTTSYNIWPVAESLKGIGHLATHLYQSLYHRVCTDKNCAVIKADEGWTSLNRCRLLKPDFRKDEIAELALRVLRTTANQTNIIVDIPEVVVKTILEVEACRTIMEQKFIDKPAFFKDWFLPNVRKIDALTRDKLVLSCLLDDTLKHLLRDIECIPVSPDGEHLKTVPELVHPDCKLAELYDAEEGCFPLWKSGVADNDEKRCCIHDALVKLGMKKHDLSWEAIADRCTVIQSHPSTAAKRTKVIISLMSANLRRKLKISQRVTETICRTKFLPVMKQPANFPIRWKGNESVLISSKEGYLIDKKYLVCCSCPVIDQQCFDAEYRDVKIMLGLFDKEVELMIAMNQVRELQKAAAEKNFTGHQHSLDLFNQVYSEVFSFLNKAVNNLKSHESTVHSELSNTNCVLIDKALLMLPSKCAMTSTHRDVSLLPYLAVIPQTAVTQYRQVFKAIGVKDNFTLADYVWILHEVQAQSQGRKLNADEMSLVIYVINHCIDRECQQSHPVTIPMEDLPVPNAAGWLCPASSLCYNNCPWLITPEDIDCCHQHITYPATVSIGIKTIRQDIMKRHRLALPFGQKERLVKRIKRIIESYPFNEDILKEMLQNADDARATTVHFIRDTRSLKTEKVFEESWKAIQGPALCVYNDKSFTKKDIQGIQSLGEGSKSDDPAKTGQYGVGFNCVYHVTDVPTFFTTVDGQNTVLCAFDPNCKYVPGADSHNPGGMFKVTSHLETNFCDVFSGYFTKQYDLSKNGTVFRLPLRTKDMAGHSEILQKAVTVDDIQSLFTGFRQDMYEALLFVNSVEEIRLREVITGSADTIKDAYSVHVQLTEDAKKRRNLFQSGMQKVAVELRKKERKLHEVEMTEVVYELTTEDSDKKRDVWQIVQRLGFVKSFPIPNTVSDAYHYDDLGRLPLGGVAYLKQSSGTGRTTTKSNRLFCFLPLPVQFPELPVHVNGHFVLSSESRRCLWTDEHKSFKSEWNRCIMEGIVAPAYCTLIRTLKDGLKNCNSDCNSLDKAKTELRKFHSVFPKITKPTVPYEDSLTIGVYRYIGAENLDVLPLLSSAKQLQNVKWMGPRGQQNKKVYFDDLDFQLQTPELTSQLPQTIYRSSGRVGIQTQVADQELIKAFCTHLKQALMRCGFLLFACPTRLCVNFEKAQVSVQRIKPEAVLDFFASYNQHATQCKLSSVPCKLSETPLSEIKYVESVLKYCCRVKDYKQRLDGLPLLVTKSLMLTTFNSRDRKYVTNYSDVAPTAPDMFVHSNISDVLRLQPTEDTHLCQQFDVADFSRLLPDILDRSDYCGSEKTVNISTLEELLRENGHDSRWLARVWSFFASFVPYSLSAVQPDNTDTCSLLMPVIDWCLLPVSCKDWEVLVPICQSSAVLDLTEEASNELADILKTLKVAEVNWKYIDKTPYQLYFMKSLLGNIHQPQCVVLVLKNLLQQSTLEGVLSMDKGLRLLAYFSDNVAGLQNDDDTKNVISQLPFFVSVYNTQISINRSRTYVLPAAGLPGNDMEIWREQLNVTFIMLYMHKTSIEKLVDYLGCKCLTVVEAYTMFIFPDFDKLSPAGQTVHIAFIRDHLFQRKLVSNKRTKSEITTLTKALKSLAFLPSQKKDGGLVTASNYYDIEQEVFKAMLPDDMFPPPPYCDLDWRDFLLDCGVIHEVTEEMFVNFATTVETTVTEEVEDSVCQQSEILLKHFLQRSDLQSSSFLDRIKSISFIQPHVVGEHLQHLHPQHGRRDDKGRLRFISLQNSVLFHNRELNNRELIWTTKNILPPCVNERALKPDGDRHHKFVKLMQQLQVIVEPSPDDVAQHVKQLCTFVASEGTDLHEERIAKTLEHALKCVYAFLNKHLPLQATAVSVLSEIPFVYATGSSCRLIRPSQFATDILEDQEIKPYLNKFPLPLGEFVDLFLQVGTTKTPTVCQYAGVLEVIHDKTGQRELLPDESKAISMALKDMFALMLHDKIKQAPLSVPKRIYFPTRSDKLLLSSDTVYVDHESLLKRLRRFQKPLLIDLKPICGLTNEEDVKKLLQKLPAAQQPTSLSSMVKECLDEGCEDSDSDIANELRNKLMSVEFRHGVERIARHCLAYKSLTPEDMKVTIHNIGDQMQKIRIIGKSEIKTYLECEGQKIANSERPYPFFCQSISEDDNSVLLICVQRNPGNLANLYCHVAKVINKAAGNLLSSHLEILTTITGSPLNEIDEVLTSHGVIEIKQFNPPVGSFVPENKHCFLVQNVFVFEIGWLVALEVDDPLDRGERGRAKYKLVEIIERLRTDHESTMADRYRVKVSTDGEEQVVDASLLYAFSRDGVNDVLEQDDEDAVDNVIVLRPPGSADEPPPPEPDIPSDFRGIIKWLKKQLKEAWTLSEEQRRRIIRRLKFQWHPDKHPPEKKSLMTKVFQFLQNLVEMLEKGRSIDDVDEDEASHSSSTRHAYDDFMGERARSYRHYQNYYWQDTRHSHDFGRSRHDRFTNSSYRDQYADFFTNFHSPSNPEPAEATRWMRQAKYDLEAANDEEAPEWACYKCYQVA